MEYQIITNYEYNWSWQLIKTIKTKTYNESINNTINDQYQLYLQNTYSLIIIVWIFIIFYFLKKIN